MEIVLATAFLGIAFGLGSYDRSSHLTTGSRRRLNHEFEQGCLRAEQRERDWYRER